MHDHTPQQHIERKIDTVAEQVVDQNDPLIGVFIDGKYRIDELLGIGGTANVYRAHSQYMDRTVAIKVLRQIPDQTVIDRFKLEAKAAFGLANKHVCSVHDCGTTPDGRLYLVMDYIEGTTLSTILKDQHRLPFDMAIEVTIQICDALSAAHERGIIHRDIKPSNVMLQRVRERDIARLVDFGLAKVDVDNRTLTGTGELIGTPRYMSPEQCQGMKLDKRTDIYSTGCVLYELITGNPPFNGNSTMSILMQHMQKEPPSVLGSGGDKKQMIDLDYVLQKALTKNREHRYQTIEQLRNDLLLLREGGKLNTGIQFPRRKIIIAACVALLFLGIGGTVVFLNSRPVPVVGTSVDNDAKSWYTLGVSLVEMGKRDDAERSFRRALELDPKDSAAWYSLSLVLLQRNEYQGSEHAARRATELNPADPDAWFALGNVLWVQKKADDAARAFRRCLQINPQYRDSNNTRLADFMRQQAALRGR